jgi:hypothetical protein
LTGQNTPKGSFKIINNANPDRLAFYEEAIMRSNLESYRLKDKDVKLVFKNGFEIELLAAVSQVENGLDASAYKVAFDQYYELPAFEIVTGGNIVALYKALSKETTNK